MYQQIIEKFKQEKHYLNFSPKAIFFDMDGVLFDSMKSHATGWVYAMQQAGISFTEYDAYLNEGRTGGSTIDEAFLKTYNRKATEEEKQYIYGLKSTFFEATAETKEMPFAKELLQTIQQQGLQILVVTGSGQPSLLDSLNKTYPNVFEPKKMVTAFDVQHGKPHPEPYLQALKKSNVHPWEAIVIENAPLGIQSASFAGLFTIAINTGPLSATLLSESGAQLVLDSIEDLYHIWKSFSENWNKGEV